MKNIFIVLIGFFLISCGQYDPQPDPFANMTAHNCTLESRVDSGRRQYCGKACYRPIFVRTYSCPATKWSYDEHAWN